MVSAIESTPPEEGIPLTSIAGAFSLDYLEALIEGVLQSRGQASGSVRTGFDSAIDERIRVPGFRYASKAHPPQLKGPVLGEVVNHGNDRLFGEALRAWAESQQELHALVEGYLRSQDLPADGPDRRQWVFNGLWARLEWNNAVDTIVQQNPELARDNVGMMVCYCSGMAVGPAVTSPLLTACIHELSELTLDAPDWDEIDAFVAVVTEMADSIAVERVTVLAEHCRETLRKIRRDFATELQYLELDVAAWAEAADDRPPAALATLELVKELERNLAEYQPLHPQAASRQEETKRAPARAERESAILDIAAKLEERLAANADLDGGGKPDAASPAPGEDSDSAHEESGRAPAPEPPGDEREPVRAAPREDYQALRAACDSLERERESLRVESDRLSAENDRLAQANAGLDTEKRALDTEIGELRAKFAQSRDLGKYWRRFYTSFAQVGSVNEAVSCAEALFPKQLAFALNSKSDKDSPFQKPIEVLAALVWLATDYHHVRWTKPGEDPSFDERLKKFCPGWSYKAHQASTTKQQFEEWYTTKRNDTTYELGQHLTKGVRADPQKTIRIAFAWDDESGRVIVGYIGQHQRNRRS